MNFLPSPEGIKPDPFERFALPAAVKSGSVSGGENPWVPSISEGYRSVAVRPLGPGDCRSFRSLRLYALETCPVFSPLIEDQSGRLPLEIERSWPTDVWMSFLENNDEGKFFGLFADRLLIGLGRVQGVNADMALLKSAFIRPEYRGWGLWKSLVAIRVRYAAERGFKEVRISYRAGNTFMKQALRRTDFVEIYREPTKVKYQDGQYGCRVVLALRLPA